MLDILYNMSADAYAKLVAHNNSTIQQFKSYKEAQERALTDAYGRLSALKEFCAKEREEMRDAFEKEKQALLLEREKQVLAFEREKKELRDGFEKEKRELRYGFEKEKRELRDGFEKEKRANLEKDRQSALALEKQSALALEKQSGGAVVTNQLVNKALSDFFKNT